MATVVDLRAALCARFLTVRKDPVVLQEKDGTKTLIDVQLSYQSESGACFATILLQNADLIRDKGESFVADLLAGPDFLFNESRKDTAIGMKAGSCYGMISQNHHVLVPTVYLYINKTLTRDEIDMIERAAGRANKNALIIDAYQAEQETQLQQPEAFLIHDARDKQTLAAPLVIEFYRNVFAVWYDDYSIQPGDSIIDSIEQGIKSCKFAIVLISKSLLANTRTARHEFKSAQVRQIRQNGGFILPVWIDVEEEEVYGYSMELSEINAVKWTKADEVCHKLMSAIRNKKNKDNNHPQSLLPVATSPE